jgi:ATP-dependent protease ClpP protease subunit
MALTIENAERAVIMFTDDVATDTIDGLLDAVSELVNAKVQALYLLISSRGGSVHQAVAAYHILRGLPINLTTHNVGIVASSANIIFAAGQRRLASPSATFMFHGVTVDHEVTKNMDRGDIEAILYSLNHDENQLKQIIQKRSKLSASKLNHYFLGHSPTFIPAPEALEYGLLDAIEEVDISRDCPIIGIAPKGAGNGHGVHELEITS